MAIRTTVVGSWWVQPDYEAELLRYHKGELSAEQGEAVLSEAAARAIKEQRDLGLTEWTGGEYFTYNFVQHMHLALDGLEIDKEEADDPFDYDDGAHARIVGDISAPKGLGYVAAFERENQLDGGVTKATVVSPWELTYTAYDQQEELRRQTPNLQRLVNDELCALTEAGCEHVQLDAPMFGTLVNQGMMTAQQAAEHIRPCLEGVNAPRRGIHICNGNLNGRPISRVLSCAPWVEILQHLEGVVDVAHLEVSYFSEYQEREAFKELPQSIELAAGIVDEASYWVEPVSKIRSRIEDWTAVVGEDRLWAAPCCGFGRHPARDIPVLRQKMQNLVEAAASI